MAEGRKKMSSKCAETFKNEVETLKKPAAGEKFWGKGGKFREKPPPCRWPIWYKGGFLPRNPSDRFLRHFNQIAHTELTYDAMATTNPER